MCVDKRFIMRCMFVLVVCPTMMLLIAQGAHEGCRN